MEVAPGLNFRSAVQSTGFLKLSVLYLRGIRKGTSGSEQGPDQKNKTNPR